MAKAKPVTFIKNGKVVNQKAETKPQKAKTPAEEIGALKAEVYKVASGLQAVTKEAVKLRELGKDMSALKGEVKKQLTDLRKQFQTQIVVRSTERELLYGNGFRAGIIHIVDVAEGFILEHYQAKDRQELFDNNKMPSFWIATLVHCLHSMPVSAAPKPELTEEIAHDFGNEFTDEAVATGKN